MDKTLSYVQLHKTLFDEQSLHCASPASKTDPSRLLTITLHAQFDLLASLLRARESILVQGSLWVLVEIEFVPP